jgi:hypothetical protein
LLLSVNIQLIFFQAINSAIHIVLDGWTAPLVASYLGIIVVWSQEGILYRAVLEFVRYETFFLSQNLDLHYISRLTQKHDGNYLAEVTGACLKRFGLANKVYIFCNPCGSRLELT